MNEKFKNAYFIIGNAYAGKSTMIELLAKEYNGIWCEENYHDIEKAGLDKNDFPNLSYTANLKDWHDFIRRSPEEYERWINGTSKECEIVELKMLDDILNSNEVKNGKKVFVDTNISIETLQKISDKDHVLVMLTDNNESVNRFFERPDKEKQFLYRLIMDEDNPQKALDNFKECLKRVNSKENYDKFLKSGFNVLLKDNNRSVDETLEIVKKMFKLK